MDKTDVLLILAVISIPLICSYVSYKYGKSVERREYMKYYPAQIQAAFWDGYTEAKKQQMLVGE